MIKVDQQTRQKQRDENSPKRTNKRTKESNLTDDEADAIARLTYETKRGYLMMETVKKLENLTISGDIIWSMYDTSATTQRNGVKCQVNLGSMVDSHASNLAQHIVYKPVYSLMIGGICASDDTTLLSTLVSLIKEQVQVGNNKRLASELKKLFNDA